MALSAKATSALLGLLGRRQALESTAADFDAGFRNADQLHAYRALALLLQARRRSGFVRSVRARLRSERAARTGPGAAAR